MSDGPMGGGGFPGGRTAIVELSVNPLHPDRGTPTALRLEDLRELVEEAARLGVPEESIVIFTDTGPAGPSRRRVTAAGIRCPLHSTALTGGTDE